MTSSNVNRLRFLLALLCIAPASVPANAWQFGGHTKYLLNASHYPADNIVAATNTAIPIDHYFDLRLKADKQGSEWSYSVHYEVLGIHGDTVITLRSLSIPGLSIVPTDDKRLFNLSQAFSYGDRFAGVHRIDRLVATYADEQHVFRFGRQAISWGNGLFFNPMDLVNPFSPTAISKEYKTGEDMAYGQWLFTNGNDLQLVLLPRRNTSGVVDENESSTAIKYRGIQDGYGYEIFLSRHYSDLVSGVGLTTDFKGAVLRTDLLATRTSTGEEASSAVVNTSYSWTWGGHNVSGNLEYYHNGFGRADGNYASVFSTSSVLGRRVARGELFGFGRDYLAGSLMIELTPRLVTTPTWIHNLNDGSGITQFMFNYDWKQDAPIVFGFAVPYGGKGTEYGGISVPSSPGQYYGPGKTVFMQLATYF
jgi:hypothetical protein